MPARRLAKMRVQCLNEVLCFVLSLVQADSLVLRNLLLPPELCCSKLSRGFFPRVSRSLGIFGSFLATTNRAVYSVPHLHMKYYRGFGIASNKP